MEKIDTSLYDDKYGVHDLPDDWENLANYNFYNRTILQYPVLKANREHELFILYREHGDLKAKDELVNCNLRLVAYLARMRANYCKRLDVDDLIQEGNIALLMAIDTFNYNEGYRFSTFLSRAVKNKFNTIIYKQDRLYRIPANMEAIYTKIRVSFEKLEEKGEEITLEKVAKMCNIKTSKVKEILKHVQHEVYIDKKMDEDDNRSSSIGDFIVDETAEGLQDLFMREQMKESFYKSLNKLSYKEKSLLQVLYLDTKSKSETLVALESNTSVEEVRKVKNKALIKLRSLEELKDYIGEFV